MGVTDYRRVPMPFNNLQVIEAVWQITQGDDEDVAYRELVGALVNYFRFKYAWYRAEDGKLLVEFKMLLQLLSHRVIIAVGSEVFVNSTSAALTPIREWETKLANSPELWWRVVKLFDNIVPCEPEYDTVIEKVMEFWNERYELTPATEWRELDRDDVRKMLKVLWRARLIARIQLAHWRYV